MNPSISNPSAPTRERPTDLLRTKPAYVSISISREGWYYLLVVLFIMVGAIMREVNLLLVLSGLMLGPFFIGWRVALRMVRQIELTRIPPTGVSAGCTTRVRLSLRNTSQYLDCWSIAVRDRIRHIDADDEFGRVQIENLVIHIPPGADREVAYHWTPERRGTHELGMTSISCQYPLGLVRATAVFDQTVLCNVAPRIGKLTRSGNQTFFTSVYGGKRSLRSIVSTDGDYFATRPWQIGDNSKFIHWRSSAKRGQLVVRQFDQPTGHQLNIALDLWQPQSADDKNRGATALAVSFVATLILQHCKQSRGDLTLTDLASGKTWATQDARLRAEDVLDFLATVQPHEKAISDVIRPTALPQTIISTRPGPSNRVNSSASGEWIDVQSPKLRKLFTFDHDPAVQP